MQAAQTELTHMIQPTGKTVGEPNQNWVIDNFKSHRLGQIDFPVKGPYEITIDVTPNENDTIKLQWIWIK